MNNWVVNYTKWIIKLRWMVLLLSIAGTLALASGGRFIEFSNDYRYFFTEQNPNLQAFEKLERTYSSPDTLLFVLKPKEGLATTPKILGIVKEITDQSWQIPFVIRVDSLTNYQHTKAFEDDLVVADLVKDPSVLTPELAEEVRQIATSEPATALRLISEDSTTTAIFATLKLERDNVEATTAAVTKARAILNSMREAHPDIRFELTGSVMLSTSFSEAAQSDISTLTPGMFVFLGFCIYLLLRSFSGTLSALTIVLLSAAGAMGFVMGWMGVKLTPPSTGAPTIILTVAVADSIHILVTMLVEMRKGKTKHEAIIESMRVNWQPVFLTSVTTAIGFLSLNFSDAPPFRDLGNASAAGSVIAWALSITLLPAMLAILPVSAKAAVASQSKMMERFSEVVIRHYRLLLVVMTIAIVFFSALVPLFKFNDRFVEYFDDRMEFRVASDWAADNLIGIYQISYSVESGEAGGISNPEYLTTLSSFADWARVQPEVVHVATFTDVIKRVNKSMHGDNQDFYRIPEERDMAAQFLLLYEMSLPYGLDLNDQINVSTAEMQEFINRGDTWLRANAPAVMNSYPAGQSVMFAFIGRNNFNAMAYGTGLALLLISGCLVVALRDIRLGFISLVPNLTPPIVAFGILALFTQEVGFWSSFVIATALGLIVDATVHFLSKYKRARHELGYSAEDGVRYAFSTVGTALWVSTFVLVAGFAILAFSPFKVNMMLGVMVALTIAVALIIDFLLLPALLIALDQRKGDVTNKLKATPDDTGTVSDGTASAST
jgi:predicted RND superfamily exporter protein